MSAAVRLLLAAALLALAAACDIGGGGDDSLNPVPESRNFFSIDFVKYYAEEGDYWYELTADRLYLGDHCAVFVDRTLTSVDAALAAAIGAEFDANVYSKIRENFAAEADVDNNGKILILVLDIPDDYDQVSNQSYMAGYFYGWHMLDYPNSNRADMIFMDADPGLFLRDGTFDSGSDEYEDFRVTLAHEFQHLVNFSEKVIRQRTGEQDTWINEGLSAGAEYVYLGGQNDWKIDYYNDASIDFIRQGQYFLSWGAGDDALSNYSTVYLFFQWLRAHASNDTGIYRDILLNRVSDYRAVSAAVAARFSGYTGTEWKAVLRDWFIANWFDEPSGFYGYKGVLGVPLAARALPTSGGTYPLLPGGGVYIGISSDYPGTPGVIDYAGLDAATGAVDAETPYAGSALLVVNTDGTEYLYPSSTAAPVPSSVSIAAEPSSAFSSPRPKSLAPPRTRFPIDAPPGKRRLTAVP